nr:signal recognition particle 72 kDa protein [Hymenolepis microstoma]
MDVDLESLYNELGRVSRTASYSKVVTTCDKILKSFPGDNYALKCKAVALIHQDRFDDCLEFFRKQKVDNLYMEKAYCEYRLNRFVHALKTLSTCPEDTPGIIELKGQIYYRLEEFENSIGEYEKLTKICHDDYQDERLTNILAAQAALSYFQGKQVPLSYSSALFETDYNAACYYIGSGDYKKAMEYLENAEKLCRETFEDDAGVTEEQINEELAPIRAQRGYIFQQQNKMEAASEIYHTILREKSGDPSLMAVISNNLVCINKDQNVFDTKKRIKAASIDSLQYNLFQAQKGAILANQALFSLNNNQFDICDGKVKAALAEDPTNVKAVVLSVLSASRRKHPEDGIKILEKFTQSPAFEEVGEENRLTIALLLLHLKLASISNVSLSGTQLVAPLKPTKLTPELAKDLDENVLANILRGEIGYLPLVASLRVALLFAAKLGDSDLVDARSAMEAKKIVNQTLDYWTKKPSDVVDSDTLLTRCIDFFRLHGFAEDAARLLEQRLESLNDAPIKNEQQRQSLLALLIQAYSKFDHEKASQASRDLDFKDKLSEKEVDSLESMFLFNIRSIKKNVAKAANATPKAGKSGGDTVAKPQQQQHKKKKRRIRLPKNYEPGVPPDPERWLPKRERTGYRGKRRDKRDKLLRGPQGVTSAAAPELDMGKPIVQLTPTPPNQTPANTATRKAQPGKPHNKKKGKKR